MKNNHLFLKLYSKLCLYCPYCGENFKFHSVYIGWEEKVEGTRCPKCHRHIPVDKKFAKIKNYSLWTIVVISIFPILRITNEIFYLINGRKPGFREGSGFLLISGIAITAPLLTLFCIFLHSHMDWIDRKQLNKELMQQQKEEEQSGDDFLERF